MMKKGVTSIFILSVSLFLASFLGSHHFLLDLLTHLWVYFFWLFALIGLLAWRQKMKMVVIGALFCLAWIGAGLAPLHIPRSNVSEERGVRIAAINLLSSNRAYDEVLKYIEKEQFDIIVFQELSFGWRRQLGKLASAYPHQKVQAQKGNFGIGIYSKIPLSGVAIHEFGQFEIPSIAAHFEHENKRYFIIGTHPVPPTNPSAFKMRNDQMRFVNQLVRNQPNEAIVVGDMNCTSFSPNFALLSEGTSLRDTRAGFGACTSWEATIPFINITIDHALVTEGISVKHRGVGPYIGSDHLPLELAIY